MGTNYYSETERGGVRTSGRRELEEKHVHDAADVVGRIISFGVFESEP